ncbi:hypothetical protein HYPSUDRAFT_138649 [Hypholoma sublateritium FD-334 SS-4]|uniref:Uncharacterized protein n=1 Tax=Hypholoma sublateritium (strain FD-334 SS-4) TaxID=945553 RepID=A0A0D2P232_HYPSF|nr:hypothetical protein HYPSUDRAFT_138649 [Hypholoma sublateritium FD-334 SS-4]
MPCQSAPAARRLFDCSENTTTTSLGPASLSKWPAEVPQDSLLLNGTASSVDNPSISMPSSPPSTVLQLMKRQRVAWETRKSALSSLIRKGWSERALIGLVHGNALPPHTRLPSLIAPKRLPHTEITSKGNSKRRLYRHITKSFPSTKPSVTTSALDNTSSSLTTTNSPNSTPPSSCLMVHEPMMPNVMLTTNREAPPTQVPANLEAKSKYAAVSMAPKDAIARTANAPSDTFVTSAKNLDTRPRNATIARRSECYGLHPKYLRYNTWEPGVFSPTTSDWTETALPLPRPSPSDLDNPVVSKTIAENPSLFKIVTPINVANFEAMLTNHPNPTFVKSVCAGLREGFWPWADTRREGFPDTHDASRLPPTDDAKAAFLRQQRDIELQKGRFSPAFGPNLLDGMYSMPIHAVPKAEPGAMRMVTDHSATDFSLNNLIDHDQVTGFPLDNMKHVGEMLLHLRASLDEDTKLVMWKADIAEAYRLLPMHPFWQIKQANRIDDALYIDRNAAFGSSASGSLFISFNGLVTWIAKNVCNIDNLTVYVDDSTGCDIDCDVLFYSPYNKFLPRHQKTLLDLWDHLGVPHKEKKQVFGSPLTVIGIDVDPNAMTLTQPPLARERFLAELALWSAEPSKTPKRAADGDARHTRKVTAHFKLKEWQHFSGYINWDINVHPYLRLALNNFYPKISGKFKPEQKVYTNRVVRADLRWAMQHVQLSNGVRVLKSISWGPDDADYIVYGDACLSGMGFWLARSNAGFFASIPANDEISDEIIHFYEALCLLSALYHIHKIASNGSRIIIHTDSSNVFDNFNTLRCSPRINPIIMAAVDILVDGNHDLRVLWIPTLENSVADALSRGNFERASHAAPGISLQTFQPPRVTMGHAKK